MSSEQPRRVPRGPGGTTGTSSAGSTVAIVIAVVAVLLGIFILRAIRDDDGPSSGGGGTTTSTSSTAPGTTTPPTTTIPPIVTTGATVVVANAAGTSGVAKTLSTALTAQQFTLGTPTNAATALDVSKIHYNPAIPAAAAVARSVAQLMGVTDVSVMPTPIPTKDGKLETGASVLVLLGKDKASLTLEQMATAATPTATPTSAATATSAAATSTTAKP